MVRGHTREAERKPSQLADDPGLLGSAVMSLLPLVVQQCINEPCWWRDELLGLHVMAGLSDLSLPGALPAYRRIEAARSVQWRWTGHALVHESSIVHSGVNFFGPVLIGPECEIGPNATIYGPTVVESGSYLGPGAEIRRCLLLSGAEVAHTSYVGHSVLGRKVRLGAFFCCAVRNLRRGTVHMISDGALVDTGEVTLGCVIADGTETGVRATVMPGRRIVGTPIVPANALVMTNC
jgi:bifunctional UDP-N-acetylglucosamine pyrophosphorylase/glucosamine-1-phosphate N-acetyltransferase